MKNLLIALGRVIYYFIKEKLIILPYDLLRKRWPIH
jgi:hypothetical protein